MTNQRLCISNYSDIRRVIQKEEGADPVYALIVLTNKSSVLIQKYYEAEEHHYVAIFYDGRNEWETPISKEAGDQIVGLAIEDTADIAYLIFLIAKHNVIESWKTTYEYKYYSQLFRNVDLQKTIIRLKGEIFCD